MPRSLLLLGAVIALAAAGWFGWHYAKSRGCGAETCARPSGEEPIVLASGRVIPVVHRRLDERDQPVVDYLSDIDRNDTAALCVEARAVWEVLGEKLDRRLIRRAYLGPTNPATEFLGMSAGIVPLYTCCVTTYIEVEKDRAGSWTFPGCPD